MAHGDWKRMLDEFCILQLRKAFLLHIIQRKIILFRVYSMLKSTTCPHCMTTVYLPEPMGSLIRCTGCDRDFSPQSQHAFSERPLELPRATGIQEGVPDVPNRPRYDDVDIRQPNFTIPIQGPGKGTAAIVVLVLSMLTDLACIGSYWYSNRLVESMKPRLLAGNLLPGENEALSLADQITDVASMAHLGILILAGVLFLFWIHSAYDNLPKLGCEGLQSSPGGAVGWYFVPIVNLFRPYTIMQEIWKASNPQELDPHQWSHRDGTTLIGYWWAGHIFSNIASQILESLFQAAHTVEAGIAARKMGMAAHALDLGTGILCVLVIRGIMQRQQEKNRRLQSGALEAR